MRKKIWVVTGSRAEYGLLRPLIEKIKNEHSFRLEIIATGQHLSNRFGFTVKEIEKDGLKISKKVKMLHQGDSERSIALSISLGIAKFSEIFSNERPDLLIILGDRFEIFASAVAAFIFRIPIAHLHGGELTLSAMDDVFRHTITKMSMLHFVSTFEYKKRVIQLGESSQRVFNVGAIGIDNIKNIKLLTRPELERQLNFKLGSKNLLVTFHSATLEEKSSADQFKELLAALDTFKDVKIIFTKPNADFGSTAILKLIDEYTAKNINRVKAFVSLGTIRYLSLVKYVDVVVGNSSSGIIEVPSLGKPTVNIGDRQKGRVRAKSVIDSRLQKKEISKAIKKALSPQFVRFCRNVDNPYGQGNTAEKIFKLIKKNIKNLGSIKKDFYTIGERWAIKTFLI